MGHPWGMTNAATAGVVVGAAAHPGIPRMGRDWVVVNLHLRPGYSGGPLFDDRGRLIGINTMMAVHDVGMVVPVHAAKRFLRDTLAVTADESAVTV